jgi:GTP-binding protein Era
VTDPARAGFATLIGRPNVGKSTLLNTIIGQKVSITSAVAQTTRLQVKGILDLAGSQVVFVDTPGVRERATTLFGTMLHEATAGALASMDVTLLVLDATKGFGKGDRLVATMVDPSAICVVNKTDIATRAQTLNTLRAAGELGLDEYFPVSARTGSGVGELVEAVSARMPEGPALYPSGTVTDVPEATWVAELVREQLLAVMRDEVPHSIACRVTEWEWPRVRCEILVERDSQTGIVIGHGGTVLKEVGSRVRSQLPPGTYLELFVKVESGWRRDAGALQKLGYPGT